MEERLRFVARLLDGESMSEVCREFGISRKTGYKIFNRYKEMGLDALTDRSRRPVRYANQLPDQVERLIVSLKRGPSPIGARARSASSSSAGSPATCGCRPGAPSMRCSTATAWSAGPAGGAIAPKARRCRSRPRPTICGAPTSKGNSSSATAATVTP
jgi:transposase-like protein